MEGWMERIQTILDRAPTRAMSFSQLVGTLKEEGMLVTGREEWILKRVEEHPEAFKVIPDRLGPWVLWPGEKMVGSLPRSLKTRGCNPWILTRSTTPPSLGIERKIACQIQESLQAWGQEIDDGSQVAVARWIGANKEAEKALGLVLSAEGGGVRKRQSTNHLLRRPQRR